MIWAVQLWLLPTLEAKELLGCSIYLARHLSNPNLVLKAWMIPTVPLVFLWCWKPEKAAFR